MTALGAERLVGFVDVAMLAHLRRYSGLRLRTQGDAQPYAEGGISVAFEIGVSSADLDRARERLGLPGRQLFDAPAWLAPDIDPAPIAQAMDVFCNDAAPQIAQLSALAAFLAHQPQSPSVENEAFERLRATAA